ncbi:hypothetical protein VNO77_44432 [Canavalia gladiata]|uniref:Uncharacterized protein n=1 Tax=Canavalia gladiata TaxID=3824 RepID=A0AAN9JX17_CANGL
MLLNFAFSSFFVENWSESFELLANMDRDMNFPYLEEKLKNLFLGVRSTFCFRSCVRAFESSKAVSPLSV